MPRLVIDISDEEYEDFKKLKEYGFGTMFDSLVERIANGVVLPKGRLIDATELEERIENFIDYHKGLIDERITHFENHILDGIKQSPTIIEEDKENKNE